MITGGDVVIAGHGAIRCGVGIKDGRIAALADDLTPSDGDEHISAAGRVVFPGGVNFHYHLGIYRPIELDAASETESSLVGGATSVISYFRTGSHYLNKTGPYREIFPEVLAATRGRTYSDYGFHIAIMTSEQIGEIDWLVSEAGVTSFKYYMFYKGLDLAAGSTDAAKIHDVRELRLRSSLLDDGGDRRSGRQVRRRTAASRSPSTARTRS